MTDEELDEFGEVIDEMRADTREYLEANGIDPEQYEYDSDLGVEDERDD
jgi:ureidoglycolate hydrolase